MPLFVLSVMAADNKLLGILVGTILIMPPFLVGRMYQMAVEEDKSNKGN